MVDLEIALDLGYSGSKIAYIHGQRSRKDSGSGKQINYLHLPSALEFLSAEQLDRYHSNNWMNNDAIDDAWIEVDGEIVAIGTLAEQFDPISPMSELKYEKALFKALAAIGICAELHFTKKKRKLTLALSILLPANEYQDRHKFIDRLQLYLEKGFKFRSRPIQVKLALFIPRPEGAGLAIALMIALGKQWWSKRILGFLMFGHRNITAHVFRSGREDISESPLLGFTIFLNLVMSRKSGLDPQLLMKAIFLALPIRDRYIEETGSISDFDWGRCHPIAALATARNSDLRLLEIAEIKNAIDLAVVEYWEKITKKLLLNLPPDLDTVVVSGGASYFVRPQLEEFFNCRAIGTTENGSLIYQAKDPEKPFTNIIWGHLIPLVNDDGIETTLCDLLDLGDDLLSLYQSMDVTSVLLYLHAKSKSLKKTARNSQMVS
ncbi:MAG: ParM/StbA family protein [Prochloraceae cyanobacterium]